MIELPKPSVNWVFFARVLRVVDGDTFHVLTDRGFHDFQEMELRLRNVDAPEVRLYKGVTPEEKARGLTISSELDFILQGRVVTIQTHKYDKEKYGRYLTDMWRDDIFINKWVADRDQQLKDKQQNGA